MQRARAHARHGHRALRRQARQRAVGVGDGRRFTSRRDEGGAHGLRLRQGRPARGNVQTGGVTTPGARRAREHRAFPRARAVGLPERRERGRAGRRVEPRVHSVCPVLRRSIAV